jgi:hypothetical protein
MTVLVCGGRDYDDADQLYFFLDQLHAERPITKIVHGAATGADTLGAMWGLVNHVFSAGYPANWKQYGKAAGMIRNQEMLAAEKIDLVVACPGGRGTADMVRRATKAGIPVRRVTSTNPTLPLAVD